MTADLDLLFGLNGKANQLFYFSHCPGGGVRSGPNSQSCFSRCPFFARPQGDFCFECPAHQEVNNYGTCSTCSPGLERPYGSDACANCPTGKHQPSPGTPCIDCEAGSYCPITGSITCFDCGSGKYSPDQGANACQDCDVGKFSENPGSSVCSECAKGGYCNAVGKASAAEAFTPWCAAVSHSHNARRSTLSLSLTTARTPWQPHGHVQPDERQFHDRSVSRVSGGQGQPDPWHDEH